MLPGVLLSEVVLWSFLSPVFLTPTNFISIARAAAAVGVLAVGQTFVILTAGIDLSVGSLVSLAGMMMATTLDYTNGALIGITVTLGFCALSGLFAGTLIARLRIPAFITTLALLNVYIALSQLWNNGAPLPVRDPFIVFIGSGYIGPIPVPVLIMALTFLLGAWVLSQTTFGRHVYAIGGNVAAARLAGIRVSRTLITVYVLSAVLAGIAAIMYDGRLATASPLTGVGLELKVVAAVIVGGTSLFGGRGRLWDTFLGVMILTVLTNGLTLVGISGFWQTFATGCALLLAVGLSGGVSLKRRTIARERRT
jgi:ribose/xylose/arabinose/galactoside ABC-type transport system permease subunit